MTILYYEVVFILIGVFAGLIAGALGLGGGVVVVPSLVFFFQSTALIPNDLVMHVAIATSLAVMIFTSLASFRAHRQMEAILWPVISQMAPGLILGACFGACCTLFISTQVLKTFFAIFLTSIAIKMGLDVQRVYKMRLVPLGLTRIASCIIGACSALLGVGGGLLLVPFLTYCGIPTRKITPIANLCGLFVALVSTLLLLSTGLEMPSVAYTWGYIYLPATLGIAIPSSLVALFGARLNYVLPVHYLQYGFIIILLLTAAKMSL